MTLGLPARSTTREQRSHTLQLRKEARTNCESAMPGIREVRGRRDDKRSCRKFALEELEAVQEEKVEWLRVLRGG